MAFRNPVRFMGSSGLFPFFYNKKTSDHESPITNCTLTKQQQTYIRIHDKKYIRTQPLEGKV